MSPSGWRFAGRLTFRGGPAVRIAANDASVRLMLGSAEYTLNREDALRLAEAIERAASAAWHP